MRIRRLLIIFISLYIISPLVCQTLPTGKFFGYENMIDLGGTEPYLYPGIYFKSEKQNPDVWYQLHSHFWFHEVTVEILSDSNIIISKVPVFFKYSRKQYSDSIGGFFYYEDCSLINKTSDSTDIPQQFIFGSITNSRKVRNCGTAVCRYTYVHYKLVFANHRKLILSTDFGEIVFKKRPVKKIGKLTVKRKS